MKLQLLTPTILSSLHRDILKPIFFEKKQKTTANKTRAASSSLNILFAVCLLLLLITKLSGQVIQAGFRRLSTQHSPCSLMQATLHCNYSHQRDRMTSLLAKATDALPFFLDLTSLQHLMLGSFRLETLFHWPFHNITAS